LASFPACYRCGEKGHKCAACKAELKEACAYCGLANHIIKVCRLLHQFCYRCACFGHRTVDIRSGSCIENGKDQSWAHFKPAGMFTCLRKFEQRPNWDAIAHEVRLKFGEHLKDVRHTLPHLVAFAFYQENNRLH
jgi:hypothetical protein